MTMMTRCDGAITVIVRQPATGWLRYAVAAPLATYTGTVATLDEALCFALTGYFPDEVGPDTQMSLDPRSVAPASRLTDDRTEDLWPR